MRNFMPNNIKGNQRIIGCTVTIPVGHEGTIPKCVHVIVAVAHIRAERRALIIVRVTIVLGLKIFERLFRTKMSLDPSMNGVRGKTRAGTSDVGCVVVVCPVI